MTIDDVISGVIDREGREFSDHAADRGGATRYGITAATLGAYRKLGRAATPDEVEALEELEARDIYAKRYVLDPGFAALPDWIRAQVVDDGVLSGPTTAAKTLQRVLGVAGDGVIGPATIAAITAANRKAVIIDLVIARATRLARIVKQDHDQAVFIEGWIVRALKFLDTLKGQA